jgi:hypothetical protein
MMHVWALVRRVFHLRSFTGSEERRAARRSSRCRSSEPASEVGHGLSSSPRRRFSIPFADIGGLLPMTFPSTTKPHSSSSGRSLGPDFSQEPRNSLAVTEPGGGVNGVLAPPRLPIDTGIPPSPSPPPTPSPAVRNPASAQQEHHHLSRGLRRADSITLLGLPDVVIARNGSKRSHASVSLTAGDGGDSNGGFGR